MYETRAERDALFRFTGKYTEVDLLNKEATGFGWAVLVQDNFENNRLKVVKLPNREAATRELLAEAEILAKIAQYLRHPNLIGLGSVDRYVIDWNDQKEERWFIVLQFGGTNLRQRLGRVGLNRQGEYVYRDGVALEVEEVLRIGLQIADGLWALHDFEEAPGQHIIHRDVKPENILIDSAGVVRLADFGISKVVERLSQSISVAGTPPYLAPEYVSGRITAASDVYALGIVLYEMATGRFPFARPEDRFSQMPPPPHTLNPRVPACLSDVIQQALWWDPRAERGDEAAQRYRHGGDLVRELRHCHGRLFPIPARFVRHDNNQLSHYYHDTEAQADVRIFLYDTAEPGPCRLRLGTLLPLDERGVLTPRQLFEPAGRIGVVVPTVPGQAETERVKLWLTTLPTAADLAPAPPPALERLEGEAVYPFVSRLVVLCRQLARLHRRGLCHGLLTPYHLHWEEEGWVIDHVWLGALAGLTALEQVVAATGVAAGFLAPEVLRWQEPPGLASDVYGVAAVLYGRLTGTAPLDSATALASARGRQRPPCRIETALAELAPTTSRRLRALLVQALQPEPAQRPRDLDELAQALSACRWPEDMIETLIAEAHEQQRRGQVVEAYDSLDRAQCLGPGHPWVHHARAAIYFREGEVKWALKENHKALTVEVTAAGCFLHAQCLAALDRHDEAVELARVGLEREESWRVRHLLGQCLEKLGASRQALAEYRQAVYLAERAADAADQLEAIRADLANLLAKRAGPS